MKNLSPILSTLPPDARLLVVVLVLPLPMLTTIALAAPKLLAPLAVIYALMWALAGVAGLVLALRRPSPPS